MPLLKGPQNMRRNYTLLVNEPVQSASRERAINTIMQTRGMTRDEAIHTQAIAIIKAQARKKK